MSEAPRYWRLRNERYQLVGEVCQNYDCGEKIFPPRDLCPHCGQPAHLEHKFSGKGEVYSYSVVYDAPEGYEKYVPYVVALVKLEEGPMVTAMLTDLEESWVEKEIDSQPRLVKKFGVEIGMPVEMVTRELKEEGERGLIYYGYKFRPPIEIGAILEKASVPIEEKVSY